MRGHSMVLRIHNWSTRPVAVDLGKLFAFSVRSIRAVSLNLVHDLPGVATGQFEPGQVKSFLVDF